MAWVGNAGRRSVKKRLQLWVARQLKLYGVRMGARDLQGMREGWFVRAAR